MTSCYTVGVDLYIRPKVPFCTNRTAACCSCTSGVTLCRTITYWVTQTLQNAITATRHQIMVGLLKKYRHQTNLTACAIEFTKTVGADLHIRPKVESSHKSTRSAPSNHDYRKRNR